VERGDILLSKSIGEKMQKTKVAGMFLVSVFVLISFASAVESGYVYLCLGDGESISITPSTYSSHSVDYRMVCGNGKCTAHLNSGSGYVGICVQQFSEGLYYPPALPSKCSGGCQSTSPGTVKNLTLTTVWPFENGGSYTKQNFLLDVSTNQIASIDFIDNVAGTQRTLCPNCNSYKRSTTFRDGFNNVTIRAVVGDHIREKTVSFFIDNRKPVISKTFPLPNKYASGKFTVVYDEANLRKVKLKYGNGAEVVLQGCASGRKQNCSVDIDLSGYENQQITYWFEIKDVVNNLVIGRQVRVNVDETNPRIISFTHPEAKGYVSFNMTIEERNFYKVEYLDNSDIRPMWKTVCSSLKNGNCFKKIFFRAGEHDLTVRVSDKAGNYAFDEAMFTI